MKEKFCKGCKQNLSINHFTKSKILKDGYENKCKKCRQEARKKYIKTCEICQSEFRTAKKETRFCGKRCQASARRKRVIKKCSSCGKSIEVVLNKVGRHNHYYCNQYCRTEHLRIIMKGENNPNYIRVDYECDGCGEEIKVIPSRLNEQKFLFCNYECYRSNIGKYFSGENNPNYLEEISLECDGCGFEFTKKPGDINHTGNNYCSQKCYIEHELVPTGITYHNHVCLECGSGFQTVKRTSKFCSGKCRDTYYSQRNKGENHPNWNPNLTEEERVINRKYPEYSEWRDSVYKRDNFTCRKCGDNTGGNLVAHHIYNYSEHEDLRTDIENGITLCKSCHREFHNMYGYRNNDSKQLNEFLNKTPIP